MSTNVIFIFMILLVVVVTCRRLTPQVVTPQVGLELLFLNSTHASSVSEESKSLTRSISRLAFIKLPCDYVLKIVTKILIWTNSPFI